MRSSSSRSNISRQRNSPQSQTIQSLHPSRISGPHEKFLAMQMLQATLFTTRTGFLIYDLINAIVHKVKLYGRLERMFGPTSTRSETYTISLVLIALFLISMIVFTFVYNYMLVHENFYGITVMAIFLVIFLIYNLINFGQYSITESSIICAASTGEISGLLYLLTLIKHKKEIRREQQLERQQRLMSLKQSDQQRDSHNLSTSSPLSPSARQMPHHRRYAGQLASSPPSILISGTDDDMEEQNDDMDKVEKHDQNSLHNSSGSESVRTHTNERKMYDSEKFGSLLSVVQQLSDIQQQSHRHSRHRRHHRSKSARTKSTSSRQHRMENDSELSEQPSTPDQNYPPKLSQHKRSHQRAQHQNSFSNLLTIPGMDYSHSREKHDDDDEKKQAYRRDKKENQSSDPSIYSRLSNQQHHDQYDLDPYYDQGFNMPSRSRSDQRIGSSRHYVENEEDYCQQQKYNLEHEPLVAHEYFNQLQHQDFYNQQSSSYYR